MGLETALWIVIPPLLFIIFSSSSLQLFLALTLPLFGATLSYFLPVNKKVQSILRLLMALLLFVFGLTFEQIFPSVMASDSGKMAIALILTGGFYIAKSRNHESPPAPYFKLAFILATIALLYFCGFSWSLCGLGALYFLSSASYQTTPSSSLNEKIIALVFGLLLTGLSLLIFKIVYLSVFPVGFEAVMYFLIVVVIGEFLINYKNPAGREQLSKFSILALALTLFLWVVLFGGLNNGFFTDPLALYLTLPGWFQNYDSFAAIQIAILFTPLLLLSSIRGTLYSGELRNSVAFSSLGSLAAAVLLLYIFRDFSLLFQSILLSVLLGVLLIFANASWKQWILFLSTVPIPFLFLPELDKRVIAQAQRMRSTTWMAPANRLHEDLKKWKPQVGQIISLSKKGGSLAYIFEHSGFLYQGYGSLTNNLEDIGDYQIALASEQLIDKDTKKILILGLGNHNVLREVSYFLAERDINTEINVVDNFTPLFYKPFLDSLRKAVGFNATLQSEIEIHHKDAFSYLASQDEGSFDLVIWNLSWPNFSQSPLIYTQEFAQLISRSLTPGGSFVRFDFREPSLNCTLASAFNTNWTVPPSPWELYGIFISGNHDKRPSITLAQEHDKACEEIKSNSISSPFRFNTRRWGDLRRTPAKINLPQEMKEFDALSSMVISHLDRKKLFIVVSTKRLGGWEDFAISYQKQSGLMPILFSSGKTLEWANRMTKSLARSFPSAYIYQSDSRQIMYQNKKIPFPNSCRDKDSGFILRCLTVELN